MTRQLCIWTVALGLTACTHKIHEGLGFDDLQINKTTKKEIIDSYGGQHTDYGLHYYKIDYEKKGISFFVGYYINPDSLRLRYKKDPRYADTSKLKTVSIKTDKIKCLSDSGLTINKRTTVQDVYKKYGKPDSRYGYGGDSIYISRFDDNSYDEVAFFLDYSQKGISFSVETDLPFIKDGQLLNDSTLIKKSLGIDSIYFRQRITSVNVYSRQK